MMLFKNKGIFLCFIGIDGSGKTTLAKMLVESMKNDGIKSTYVYNRSRPFVTKPIMDVGKVLFLHGKDAFSNYKEHSSMKRNLFKNPLSFTIYQNLILFDYFFQTVIKIKIPLLLGKSIICDRYIYDTIITDFVAYTNYSTIETKKLLEKWLNLFPKPDLVFLLDVPENIAYQRKDDTPSLEYLKERRGIYLSIGREYKMAMIDGLKDLNEIRDFIMERVEEYLVRNE